MAGHHGLRENPEGFLSSWRNTGLEGFVETTDALGLSGLHKTLPTLAIRRTGVAGAINGTITSMLRGIWMGIVTVI